MRQTSRIIEVAIKDLYEGYTRSGGTRGYGGKLIIRPEYQREFVYDKESMISVIDTILEDLTLGMMHWCQTPDGDFELMDGQQRTISIMEYCSRAYELNSEWDSMIYDTLPVHLQERIMNHKLTVSIFDGNESKKIKWFKKINTTGEKLTHQEILNAVYSGSFVNDARRYFSSHTCRAYKLAEYYMLKSLKPIRQHYLGTALKWRSGGNVEKYLGTHRGDNNASDLIEYWENVFSWVGALFPKELRTHDVLVKGQQWGYLYNKYSNLFSALDAPKFDKEVKRLVLDDAIQNKKGIYRYLFDRNEKHLRLRVFSHDTKKKVMISQGKKCAICNEHLILSKAEAHHEVPWSEGGHTVEDNCRMLCKPCHREITRKQMVKF